MYNNISTKTPGLAQKCWPCPPNDVTDTVTMYNRYYTPCTIGPELGRLEYKHNDVRGTWAHHDLGRWYSTGVVY